MNREKWLYTGVEEGGVVLHDYRYRKLHISGKKVKIVQVVGAALLLCLFCRIYLGEILFPARNRIEATKSVPLPYRGEMICDFNDVRNSPALVLIYFARVPSSSFGLLFWIYLALCALDPNLTYP
jgi:hypothetical protein